MKFPVLFAALVSGLCLIPTARADSVLVGNTALNQASAISPAEFIAQPFVLSQTSLVSALNVSFISNVPDSLIQIELTNSLGAAATILAGSSFATSAPFNPPPMTFSVGVNELLQPGTYYIIATAPVGSPGVGWLDGSAAGVGTIPFEFFSNSPNNNNAFPPASTWLPTHDQESFQVVGATVPEPGTLALVCAGLAGIIARRRKALKR
jgi:PEP-CTERM motif